MNTATPAPAHAKPYEVVVSVALVHGFTAEDAEIDIGDLRRKHTFPVNADDRTQAEGLALDEFHSTIPIGLLEAVTISARATPLF